MLRLRATVGRVERKLGREVELKDGVGQEKEKNEIKINFWLQEKYGTINRNGGIWEGSGYFWYCADKLSGGTF